MTKKIWEVTYEAGDGFYRHDVIFVFGEKIEEAIDFTNKRNPESIKILSAKYMGEIEVGE